MAYHLRIAKAADSTLEPDHVRARPIRIRQHTNTAEVQELISYVRETGQFPSMKDPDAAVRKLGSFLYRKRRELRLGVLSDEDCVGLNAIHGWDGPGGKKVKEDQQWDAKLEALAAYLQAGNDWPRNGTGKTEEERAHGRWLGTQRHLRHAGKLLLHRYQTLDEKLPGWTNGRKNGPGPLLDEKTRD